VLDAVQRRLRVRVLELEARHDEGTLPVCAEDEGDRPLRRHEGEADVVEDVAGVEEDGAGETVGREPLEERVAPRAMLLGGDRDGRLHAGGGYSPLTGAVRRRYLTVKNPNIEDSWGTQ
jgi:hypothetical protein